MKTTGWYTVSLANKKKWMGNLGRQLLMLSSSAYTRQPFVLPRFPTGIPKIFMREHVVKHREKAAAQYASNQYYSVNRNGTPGSITKPAVIAFFERFGFAKSGI